MFNILIDFLSFGYEYFYISLDKVVLRKNSTAKSN